MNEFLAEVKELAEMVKSEDDWYDLKKQADIVLDLLDDVEAEGENYAVVLKLTEKERTTYKTIDSTNVHVL